MEQSTPKNNSYTSSKLSKEPKSILKHRKKSKQRPSSSSKNYEKMTEIFGTPNLPETDLSPQIIKELDTVLSLTRNFIKNHEALVNHKIERSLNTYIPPPKKPSKNPLKTPKNYSNQDPLSSTQPKNPTPPQNLQKPDPVNFEAYYSKMDNPTSEIPSTGFKLKVKNCLKGTLYQISIKNNVVGHRDLKLRNYFSKDFTDKPITSAEAHLIYFEDDDNSFLHHTEETYFLYNLIENIDLHPNISFRKEYVYFMSKLLEIEHEILSMIFVRYQSKKRFKNQNFSKN